MKPKTIIIFISLVVFSSCLFSSIFFGDIPLIQLMKYSLVIVLFIGGAGLLAALIKLIFASKESTNEFLINLSVLVTTCTLLLVLGEFSLRYLYSDVTTAADGRSYFSQKWLKTIRRNSFGFREKEFQATKSEDTYRIAVIGDSFTFGQGIAEEDRFSNIIEKQLNSSSSESNMTYEVLNFGKAGAQTKDHVDYLKDFVLPAKPDFIILQWYKNDVLDPLEKENRKKHVQQLSKLRNKLHMDYKKLVANSALFYFLRKQLPLLERTFLSKPPPLLNDDEAMWARFGAPDSPDSLRAKSTLEEFLEITRKNNIPMGMILFTDSYFRPSSELDFLLVQVLDVCAQEKLTCIDMREPLAPYKGDMTLWASRLDPHPSAFANRIAADRIFAEFGSVWLKNP